MGFNLNIISTLSQSVLWDKFYPIEQGYYISQIGFLNRIPVMGQSVLCDKFYPIEQDYYISSIGDSI